MNTTKFSVGDFVLCVNARPLSKTGFGPDLVERTECEVKEIYTEYPDGLGGPEFQHLHVGLITEFEMIRSLDTGKQLPATGQAWCHPSRFEKVSI